jgi:hypothetical protein
MLVAGMAFSCLMPARPPAAALEPEGDGHSLSAPCPTLPSNGAVFVRARLALIRICFVSHTACDLNLCLMPRRRGPRAIPLAHNAQSAKVSENRGTSQSGS